MIDINNSPILAGRALHLTCDQPAAIYTAGELQVWTVEISYAALACPNRGSFKASMSMDDEVTQEGKIKMVRGNWVICRRLNAMMENLNNFAICPFLDPLIGI